MRIIRHYWAELFQINIYSTRAHAPLIKLKHPLKITQVCYYTFYWKKKKKKKYSGKNLTTGHIYLQKGPILMG